MIEKSFILILFIVIFEGAAGKWINPSFFNIFVAIRDIAALFIIVQTIKNQEYIKNKEIFLLTSIWTCAVVIWGGVQLIFNQSSVVVYLIGIRFWVLYLWMAICVSVVINEAQLKRIFKILIIYISMMLPLAVLQHFNPPGHILNYQTNTEESDIFRVAGDIVRVTGTFSFTIGYTCFLGLMLPISLGSRWLGNRIGGDGFLLANKNIAMIFIFIATLVSGSRSAVVNFVVLYIVSFLLWIFFTKDDAGVLPVAKIINIIIIAGVGVSSWYIFGEAFLATQERFEIASGSEDFFERIGIIFFGVNELFGRENFIGYGVGAASNLAGYFNNGDKSFTLAESEPARVILEGGFLGVIFIFAKIYCSVKGVFFGFKYWTVTREFFPLILWISIMIAFLAWPLSGQLSVNAIAYIFLAIGLSVNKISAEKTKRYLYE